MIDDPITIENVVVGGGPGGLYTAWRLATAKKEKKINGNIQLFEWGDRLGGRIFTKRFDSGQFIELGGMRFSSGHKLVNQVIDMLGLRKQVVDFTMVEDRLFYLRGEHIYLSEIGKSKTVPYNTRNEQDASTKPDDLFARISNNVAGQDSAKWTRSQWCQYFENGVFPKDLQSGTYQPGDIVGNMGYWNLMYDQLGSEAFQYAADAGGYTSNIINWNAANALPYNGEFGANDKYERLIDGYTTLINALQYAATDNQVVITRGMRLLSFTWNTDTKTFDCLFQQYANGQPTGQTQTIKAVNLFLCMPRNGLDLITDNAPQGHILRSPMVRYYIESVIEQPSYKIAMLFDTDWWNKADYQPRLKNQDGTIGFGPTVTDIPLRQIYYFGNNAGAGQAERYGLLASYDDMWFTDFWKSLEIPIGDREEIADSNNLQPLSEGSDVPARMVEMLREQLNQVHFNGTLNKVPMPVQAVFMDWGRNPFGAGYHAWKSHYSLCDSMQKIRAPYKIVNQDDNTPLYVIGSAYSNDQAWIEGAFCTADSVLKDYFGIPPIVDDPSYPLICSC